MSVIDRLYNMRSKSKDAWMTTSYTDDSITRGYAFEVRRNISVPVGTKYVVLTTTNIAEGKTAFFLPLCTGTDSGAIYMDSYKIDSFTGGTVYNGINMNEFSSITPDITVVDDVTPVGTAGDDLRQYIIGVKSTNQSSGGGSGRSDIPKLNKPDKDVVLKLTNSNGSTIILDFCVMWFELPVNNSFFSESV